MKMDLDNSTKMQYHYVMTKVRKNITRNENNVKL